MQAAPNSWNPDPETVLVVSGVAAREQAVAFRVYHCQNDRRIRDVKWVAFYAEGAIEWLAEASGPAVSGVVLAARPDAAELVKHMSGPGMNGDPSSPRTVIWLKAVRRIGRIENDYRSKSGKLVAWAMTHRYTTLTSLLAAERTSQLP